MRTLVKALAISLVLPLVGLAAYVAYRSARLDELRSLRAPVLGSLEEARRDYQVDVDPAENAAAVLLAAVRRLDPIGVPDPAVWDAVLDGRKSPELEALAGEIDELMRAVDRVQRMRRSHVNWDVRGDGTGLLMPEVDRYPYGEILVAMRLAAAAERRQPSRCVTAAAEMLALAQRLARGAGIAGVMAAKDPWLADLLIRCASEAEDPTFARVANMLQRDVLLERTTLARAIADDLVVMAGHLEELTRKPVARLEAWPVTPGEWAPIAQETSKVPAGVDAIRMMLEARVRLLEPTPSFGEEARRLNATRERFRASGNPFLAAGWFDEFLGDEPFARYRAFHRRVAVLSVCLGEAAAGEGPADPPSPIEVERVLGGPVEVLRGADEVRCTHGAGAEDRVRITLARAEEP